MRPIPPLFDVVLLGTTGESWTLAGFERITSGALQQEFFLGQSWLVTRHRSRISETLKTNRRG